MDIKVKTAEKNMCRNKKAAEEKAKNNNIIKNKMAASLSLQEEEMLAERVKEVPALHDKQAKSYKEKGVVKNAWGKVAENLDFVENGNYFLTLLNYSYINTRKSAYD